jgi:hypothetical protein
LRRHSPPTACRQTVSGSISLPSPGFFSPFPHGTGALSVAGEYLALGGGPPGFPRGFTCPVVLGIPLGRLCGFAYRAFTLFGRPFQAVPLPLRLPFIEVPQPRVRFPEPGLGCSPFARRYLGNRGFFLFLEVLRCFSSLGSRAATYGFSRGRVGITPPRFPHSGIPGSMPACGSPGLIAACHALHRFPAPRHPPFALSSLTTNAWKISPGYTRESPYSVVKDLASRLDSREIRFIRLRLVEMTGIEPVTPCLQSRCSPS